MPSILVQAPDQGINTLLPANLIGDRQAASGSQNVLYRRGLIRTPFGFSKWDTESPLNGGDTVLGLFTYPELDSTEHVIAVTREKIYKHDNINSEWDDITQSGVTMNSDIYHPISHAVVAHTDAVSLNGTGSDWYYHLIICDGGLSNIQRWAGKYETDCADLAGGEDYHPDAGTVTAQRALQVGVSQSRLILISPLEYNDATSTWQENPQRVRWPVVGELETWTGTGSGYIDLVETGDRNVWSAPLGSTRIVYQKHSIWGLFYVGGTDVFRADVLIPNLGLLAPHLLVAKNNVHYFVGNDYNVYAYYGGNVKNRIGDEIQKDLEGELAQEYAYRCWMAVGAQNSRLWIFIVPEGSEYVTKAYGMDMTTGKWQVRDYSHKWSSGGITAVSLVGASSYVTGDTYRTAETIATTYADAVTSGETYSDVLQTIQTDEKLTFSDSDGYVYQYSSTLTTDDGEDIPAVHLTKVFDLNLPDNNKRWEAISIVAKGSGIVVDWNIDDQGFTSNAVTSLTDDFTEYTLYINDTGKRIQFRFTNSQGSTFRVSSFKVHEPDIEGNI